MGEVLIKAENVSKKFAKDFKRSLYYGVKDVFSRVSGAERKNELRKTEFWAVKEVSFEVRRGECLGLIGHNGAGKSTLLKILNGLIAPDEGSIIMRGKVGALIELGAGFNPVLTGRENIYNNAAIIGFSKEEIDAKFDSIIAFSEIGEFLDMPVQNYSSGMKVRLGFAIAAQMEPDVLLIDEVLSVGDIGFRIKCLNRISELLNKCAVIFVSHSMPQVGKICTNAMLMQKGRNIFYTPTVSEAIQKYYLMFESESVSEFGNGKCELLDFQILNSKKEDDAYVVHRGDGFHFKTSFVADKHYQHLFVTFVFFDMEMKAVAAGTSIEQNIVISNTGQPISADVRIPNYLVEGSYTLTLTVSELKGKNFEFQGDILFSKRNFVKIYSKGSRVMSFCPVQLSSEWVLTLPA